jgi:hypothetical protein
MGSKTKVKTWADQEILTHTDLNAEIDNLYSSPMTLISPCDASLDMNAQTIILDGDQDTTIKSDTDDQIDFTVSGALVANFKAAVFDLNGNRMDFNVDGDSSIRESADDVVRIELQAFDAIILDGSVGTPVNGLQIATAATGNPCTIAPQGEAGAALSVDLNGGPLVVDVNGDAIIEGIDNDDVIDFKIQSFDALRVDGSATTPVNGLTIASQATGVDATITAHGETNIGVNLVPAGTGTIKIDGGILAGKCFNASFTWDILNLAPGGQDVETGITVTGASMGDFVLVSCSSTDLVRVSLFGFVASANNVTVIATNNGTAIDHVSETFKVRVLSLA